MAQRKNAKGGGTIRKKTVIRNGREYTYWGGPCHRGPGPWNRAAGPALFYRQDAGGSPQEDAGGCGRRG